MGATKGSKIMNGWSWVPGENLAIKVWDSVVDRGLGGILRTFQIRREVIADAEARRQAALIIEKTRADIDAFRAGSIDIDAKGNLLPKPTEQLTVADKKNLVGHEINEMTFPEAVQKDAHVRELEKATNLASITLMAADEAQDVPEDEISGEQVDPDWFIKWRKNAEEVSSEELQQIWARVLCEEVKNPGSHSLRLMSFLGQLSKGEALCIQTVGPLLLAGDAVFKADTVGNSLEKFGLSFSTILHLEELGILTGTDSIGGLMKQIGKEEVPFIAVLTFDNKKQALVFQHDEKRPKLDFPIYLVTRLGQEVLSLGQFEPNMEYIQEVAEFAKKKGLKVSIGKWTIGIGNAGTVRDMVEI